MNNKHAIGRRLRKARVLMGFSRKEVMEALGLQTTTHICDWERGERLPGVQNLLKLSVLYKTLPDSLLYELRQDAIKEIGAWMKEVEDKKQP